MAITGVELKVLDQVLRFSDVKVHQAGAVGALGGDDFWTLVDDAADETYENRVKGQDMTNLDAALNDGSIGVHARQWFSLHDQYANRDLGLTGGLVSLVQSWNWRTPEKFADVHREALSRDMAASAVSASQDRKLAQVELNAGGSYVTPPTLTPLNSNLYSDTPLRLIKRGGAQGASGVTVDLELKTFLNETSPLAVSIAIPALHPNDTPLAACIGEVVPDNLDIGDAIIEFTGAGHSQADLLGKGFVDGGWILIHESLSGQETPQFIKLKPTVDEGVVDNGGAGELHFATGYTIRHDYTGSAKVYPCFKEVVSASHLDAEPTEFDIQPRNDFTLTPFP